MQSGEKRAERVVETTAVAVSAAWAQPRVIVRIVSVVLLVLLLVIGFLWLLNALQSVILLVVLAIFFAYLIAPLVEFVQRPVRIGGRERMMPRGLAIGVVYLVIFGGLTII